MPDEDVIPTRAPTHRRRLIATIVGVVFAPFLLLSLGLWAVHTFVEQPAWEIPVLGLSVIAGCVFIARLPIPLWVRLVIGFLYIPAYSFALFLYGWIFLSSVLERPMRLW